MQKTLPEHLGSAGWVGFDLDGTLAVYTGWKGPDHIGEPIPPMIAKVKELLEAGTDVRIFTARVCSQCSPEELEIAKETIKAWCKEHIGQELLITAEKDWGMIEYYDDRAVGVEYNTGQIKGG